MSEEALLEFITDTVKKANEPKEKREILKIWVGILGFSGVIFTCGICTGKILSWAKSDSAWKQEISVKVNFHDKYIVGKMAIENANRVIYNDTVKFKTYTNK